ncbi:SusD/RagB family nutrient-binding outer membrane lipoprotein [Halosquirtibacter laminarini]|uniref:SusD/RagB family nutrient-binding outer membrane lipoprotein n=1 Tax=Halosquirtibacter laminarini TaxID=3374600 RepID=A0AC61NPH4_9BACT|nr:SusD/RagB family nutrient-binding outer membrane lipoprotein [Prolixibacteraceae bacterium]
MKTKLSKNIYTLFFVLVFLSTSCTNDFEEMNKDPYKVEDISTGPLFGTVQKSIKQELHYMYQIQQNLNGDLYCGYMTSPNPYENDHNNSTYSLMDGWNETPYKYRMTGIMKPISQILKLSDERSKDFIAIAKILRVLGMHEVTDSYGPIPYSSYGVYDTYAPYDSQKEVYDSFFKDLAEADKFLKEVIAKNPAKSAFKKYDYMLGGDYSKWRRLGNSLRLRLAIRISNVDYARAKMEAEKAVANGVLNETDGVVGMLDVTSSNPLYTISNVWHDAKLGANMESILVGLKDPRLEKYFTPTEDAKAKALGTNYTLSTGEAVRFQGIRNGVRLVNKGLRTGFSTLGKPWQESQEKMTPIYFIVPAEIYFLRAEGALKGFNMNGTAEALYKEGVEVSMKQWGVEISKVGTYLNDETSHPSDYVDPINQENNIVAASHVSIKWDESLSKEEKLEKIITQKWIANFPNGQESWSEFRRTGYPKLHVIKTNDSYAIENGQVDSKIKIRRLPFPKGEVKDNIAEVKKAYQYLSSGKDNAGTRLWWDTGSNKFN